MVNEIVLNSNENVDATLSYGYHHPVVGAADWEFEMEENTLKMEPKKRQQITVQVKAELCIYKKNNPTATHEQLAAKFGISSRKTVTGILHDSDKWIKAGEESEFDQPESQKKKLRGCEFPKVSSIRPKHVPFVCN